MNTIAVIVGLYFAWSFFQDSPVMALSIVGCMMAVGLAVSIGKRKNIEQRRARIAERCQAMGAANMDAVKMLIHIGGHPGLPTGIVAAWPTIDGIRLAPYERGEPVDVLYSSIDSVDLHRREHREQTGASYSGTRIFGVWLGQRKNQSTTTDDSTTTLAFRSGRVKMKMIFAGGEETYAAVSSLMANVEDAERNRLNPPLR